MIGRSARLILIADASILLSNVASSLIGARALGPAGRGDLLIVAIWPPVVAMIAGLGLPTAYRYRMAKEPALVSALFSNALIYTAIVGTFTVAMAELIVPHLVGERSAGVMMLVRIYQVNILAALLLDLMRGLLEGTRPFWLGGCSPDDFLWGANGGLRGAMAHWPVYRGHRSIYVDFSPDCRDTACPGSRLAPIPTALATKLGRTQEVNELCA
jgi:hypothetical protein